MYFERWQSIVKHKFVAKKPKGRMILWQEVFDNNNPREDAIIHVWNPRGQEALGRELGSITKAGHQVLVSSCWYLDWVTEKDWVRHYECDPRGFNGTEQQKALVLGGAATFWGEYIDATNLEDRAWPRASAVAERLWSSPKAANDAAKAWPRLHEHRCRMVYRGYRAQPVNGPDFCEVEYEPNEQQFP